MFRLYYVKGQVHTITPRPGERGEGIVRMASGWYFEDAQKVAAVYVRSGYAVFVSPDLGTVKDWDCDAALKTLLDESYAPGIYSF